jgi:hypothetical protein
MPAKFANLIITATALLACLASAPAIGAAIDSMNLANELGSVLASEKLCGLTYDQDAISAFIESKVSAKDMSFANTLMMMTRGNEVQLEDLSPAGKVAHCTQIRRVAKSYGFVK